MKRTASLTLTAALMLAAVPARAQAPATDVPIGIVRALFGSPEWSQPDSALRVYVGATPPRVDAGLLPGKPVSVVASSTSPGGTTMVLAYPTGSGDAAESYLAFLQSAGWIRPVYPAPRGGFVASGIAQRVMDVCRDSARASAYPVPGAPAGKQWVRVHLYGSRGQRCEAHPLQGVYTYALEFPALVPPPGATMISGGGAGGSIDTRETSTRLLSSMSVADLLAHYVAQLQKAGWTVGERLVGDAIGVQALTVRDSQGEPWRGILSVVPTGAMRDVRLSMSKSDER